jgi:hypothetical protein
MPPKRMDPGEVIDLGKARYQHFLVELQAWLRAKKGRLRGATLIVSQVNVAIFVNGSVVNVPRTIAFLNAGKSVDKQWLQFFSQENIGFPFCRRRRAPAPRRRVMPRPPRPACARTRRVSRSFWAGRCRTRPPSSRAPSSVPSSAATT